MEGVLGYVEATLTTVRQSIRLVEPGGDELFFDFAVCIEERTTDQALDRLDRQIATGF